MAKMTLHKRVGLFHVDITEFHKTCLPYPEKVLEGVARHLPVIAAKRNDVLLNVIKVWSTTLFLITLILDSLNTRSIDIICTVLALYFMK